MTSSLPEHQNQYPGSSHGLAVGHLLFFLFFFKCIRKTQLNALQKTKTQQEPLKDKKSPGLVSDPVGTFSSIPGTVVRLWLVRAYSDYFLSLLTSSPQRLPPTSNISTVAE